MKNKCNNNKKRLDNKIRNNYNQENEIGRKKVKTGIVKIEIEKVTVEPFAWSEELTPAEKRTLTREIKKADYSNELTFFSLDEKTMGFETPSCARIQKSYSRKIY